MENEKKRNGFGIASLVLGILGLVLSCVLIGIILDVLAVVFGIVAIKSQPNRKGTAIAGIITAGVGIVIFIIVAIAVGHTATLVEPVMKTEVVSETETEQTETETETEIKADVETEADVETQTEVETESEAEVETEEKETETEVSSDVNEQKSSEIESEVETAETEEEYKASCQEYNYKDVLRNPGDYVGQRVKITAKISSVHDKGWLNPVKYYFAYTNDEYDMWIGDEYGVFDYREDGDFKILEDDVIVVYGEIAEPQETVSFIVNSDELFCIDMKYAELVSE